MRLYARYILIADDIDGLDVAVAKTLTQEGAEIIIEDNVLEELHSDSPLAAERYSVGAKITIKAVLTGHSLDDISDQLNVTNSSGFSVSSSRISQLPKSAVAFAVNLSNAASEELYVATDMQFTGSLSAPFKGGSNMFYLPIELSSTADTTLSVSQRAVTDI